MHLSGSALYPSERCVLLVLLNLIKNLCYEYHRIASCYHCLAIGNSTFAKALAAGVRPRKRARCQCGLLAVQARRGCLVQYPKYADSVLTVVRVWHAAMPMRARALMHAGHEPARARGARRTRDGEVRARVGGARGGSALQWHSARAWNPASPHS